MNVKIKYNDSHTNESYVETLNVHEFNGDYIAEAMQEKNLSDTGIEQTYTCMLFEVVDPQFGVAVFHITYTDDEIHSHLTGTALRC